MKEIILTRGYKALVDDADYQYLSNFKWYYDNRGYARRDIRVDGKYKAILMHRFLINLDFDDLRMVDHINGNKLDNRRENLRICSNAENCRNSRKPKNNTSGYKGVFKHVCKHKRKDGSIWSKTYWCAEIRMNGKLKYLGKFPFTDEGKEQAKECYNAAALKYFGEFALLND